MDRQARLASILKEGVGLYEADDGILSVIPPDAAKPQYDSRLRSFIYDNLVGSRLYSRLVWGTDSRNYAAFERHAIDSTDNGWMLDAGCGSLVFTVEMFAAHEGRPIVLLDRSMEMLRRARRRLEGACGRVPGDLILLQGDIFDLPFPDGTFSTVSCPFVVHLFEDLMPLVTSLKRVLAQNGNLCFTTLVAVPERKASNRYLGLLHRQGEIAAPRTAGQIAERLRGNQELPEFRYWTEGNVGYFTTEK